jgi:hypothetical protein
VLSKYLLVSSSSQVVTVGRLVLFRTASQQASKLRTNIDEAQFSPAQLIPPDVKHSSSAIIFDRLRPPFLECLEGFHTLPRPKNSFWAVSYPIVSYTSHCICPFERLPSSASAYLLTANRLLPSSTPLPVNPRKTQSPRNKERGLTVASLVSHRIVYTTCAPATAPTRCITTYAARSTATATAPHPTALT